MQPQTLYNFKLANVSQSALIIENGHISKLLEGTPLATEALDCQGFWLMPGFLDLQLYGGAGAVFDNELSKETLYAINDAHLRHGTTQFLITLPATSMEKVAQAITIVKEVMAEKSTGIMGLHLEGPFINPLKAGAHDIRYIQVPDKALIDTLLNIGEGTVKMWTIAPELFSDELLAYVLSKSLLVSLGHSTATFSQAAKAFRLGARCCTHLFNAMSALESREAGLVGACLHHDQVWATVIVDGMHVSYETLGLAMKLKPEKLLLISDATFLGVTKTHVRIGDVDVIRQGKAFYTKDGRLAGSAISMHHALKNLVQHMDVPLSTAIAMATERPAQLLGMDSMSMIAPGKRADLVLMDAGLNLKGILQGGVWKYKWF